MIIYKTTNLINGKFYVGKDSHNNPEYYGSGIALVKAIQKYGKENFKKEILEYCNFEKELIEKEICWIQKLNALNREIAYNIAEGGKGGNTRKGYTKKQMTEYLKKQSESQTGRVGFFKGKKRPEHSQYLKDAYASGERKPWNKGVPVKASVCEKIRKANMNRILTKEWKDRIAKSKWIAVVMLSIEGKPIREFESIKEASEIMKIGRDSISCCCKGKQITGGGYKWEYK